MATKPASSRAGAMGASGTAAQPGVDPLYLGINLQGIKDFRSQRLSEHPNLDLPLDLPPRWPIGEQRRREIIKQIEDLGKVKKEENESKRS